MAITQGIVAIKDPSIDWADYSDEQGASKFDAVYDDVASAVADIGTQTGDLIVRGIGQELRISDFTHNQNGFNFDVSPAMYEYELDFGDGGSVSDTVPFPESGISRDYGIGYYTVNLRVLTSEGYSDINKVYYVKVFNTPDNLFDERYISSNNVSYRIGYNKEQGLGASENVGANWVWPESRGAISEIIYQGERYKLVWDIHDDKQYIVNLKEGTVDNAYLDKGIYEIATEIILPEFTGEQREFDLKHLETNVFFKPLIGESAIRSEFELDVSIRDNSREEPVAIRRNVNKDREIMFYYQNREDRSSNTQNVSMTTSISDYQLLEYDSYYRVLERFRLAADNASTGVEVNIGAPSNWYTRGYGYGLDRVTGTVLAISGNTINGPDSRTGTGISLTSVMTLDNSVITNGTLLFWKLTDGGDNIINGGSITYTELCTCDEWTLCYYTGAIPANTQFSVGSTLFDVRVFNGLISTSDMELYAEDIEGFLPRA